MDFSDFNKRIVLKETVKFSQKRTARLGGSDFLFSVFFRDEA